MFGIVNFEVFLIAGLILNLTPGADTMYIIGRSVSQGKKAGILSALGISTGGLVHCILAALGLSIILAESALAFMIVKYVGAAYLIYLGLRTLISRSNKELNLDEVKKEVSFKRVFVSGILTNILNPKVALFFLAFLPQFISTEYTQSPIPFIILGMIFLTTGTIWCLLIAIFASKMSVFIRENYRIKFWMDKIVAGVFIALGIKLALSKT